LFIVNVAKKCTVMCVESFPLWTDHRRRYWHAEWESVCHWNADCAWAR